MIQGKRPFLGQGNMRRPRFGANVRHTLLASPFTPLLYSPVLWLKSDQGVFQDAALTTAAVADGDPVGGWQDLSASGLNLTQSIAGSRPTLKLNIRAGKPVIRFNGINNYLGGGNSFNLGSAFTTFVVFQTTDITKNQCVFGKGFGNNYNLSYTTFVTASKLRASLWLANSSEVDADSTDIANNTFLACAVQYDQVNLSNWVTRDVAIQTASTLGVAYSTDNFYIGAYDQNAFLGFLTGDVSEVVLYNTALPAPKRTAVLNYLLSRWAL